MAGRTGKRAAVAGRCTICQRSIAGDFMRMAKDDDRHTGCEYPNGPNAPSWSALHPNALKLTALEAEALDWAVSGHNSAVEDPSYHQDNPEDATIARTNERDPAQWPAGDVEDVLYRLEVQAPSMGPGDPDCEAFGRTCTRVARKIRAARPDGDKLDTGF